MTRNLAEKAGRWNGCKHAKTRRRAAGSKRLFGAVGRCCKLTWWWLDPWDSIALLVGAMNRHGSSWIGEILWHWWSPWRWWPEWQSYMALCDGRWLQWLWLELQLLWTEIVSSQSCQTTIVVVGIVIIYMTLSAAVGAAILNISGGQQVKHRQ